MHKKDDSGSEKSLSYGIKDGASYSMMTGIGESYLIPFALFFKASSTEIGFIVSVPQLFGAFFQLFSVYLLSSLNNRKQLILSGVGLQAVAWLPLLWMPLLIPEHALFFLGLGASLYFLLGNLASPPWNSLMGDLVPRGQRGNYFGRRTKIMSLCSFSGLCAGGVTLHFTHAAGHPAAGFILIFMLAAVFRIFSFYYLKKMEEPSLSSSIEKFYLTHFYRHFKHSNFLRFVIFSALISFSVQVAAPFFAVYMLRDLHFTYLQYMLVAATAVLSQYLTFLYWGNFSDRFGNRMVLKITGLMLPFLPIMWLFSPNFYYILTIQILSGFIWAGFSLSITIFIFDAVSSEKRAVCIAVYSTLNALGIFFGAMVGGLLTNIFPVSFDILHWSFHLRSKLLFLFFISGALRLIVYLTFLPKIQEVREVEAFSFKQAFYKHLRSTHPYK
ncbi:MAG: MFS transporter [Nitrospirae bacterium]|nr:MFS transporter [Nitrospirota bacterium]